MTPAEKSQIISDIATIKTQVGYIHDEMHPQIKKNTRFRIMLTGFVLISLPIIGLVIRLF